MSASPSAPWAFISTVSLIPPLSPVHVPLAMVPLVGPVTDQSAVIPPPPAHSSKSTLLIRTLMVDAGVKVTRWGPVSPSSTWMTSPRPFQPV